MNLEMLDIKTIQSLRKRHIGPSFSVSYQEPLHIVRGEDVWLYDAEGKKYLDVYNNVAHVGHSNPYVVEAITKQAKNLNTNTRYLHENIVDLAEKMCEVAGESGIITKMMRNPDFRIDYGTITSCHMLNPDWDKPLVTISSNRNAHYYSPEVMNEQAGALGEACAKAIEESGKKVVLISSHSLSHRHFVTESPLPEDMSREHIYNHSQYVWDMKLVDLMRGGKMREVIDIMPEFTEQTIAETEAGGLTWMMAAMGYPDYPAEIYGYQSVIGTGNLIAAWDPMEATREIVL